MPRSQRTETQATSTSAVTVVTTAETVAVTLPMVATDGADDRVDLAGQLSLQSGAATTGVRLRIRRGSLAGTVVADSGNMGIVGAAGSLQDYEVDGQDTPGEYAGAYVLTVQQTAATGNGSVNPATLQAVY